MTAQEVADLLGVSSRKVYELCQSGRLQGYRYGRAVRFDLADVEAFKASCKIPPPPVIQCRLPLTTVRLKAADPGALARFFEKTGTKTRRDPRKSKQGNK